MKHKVIVTGRALVGKSLFLEEGKRHISNSLEKNWSFEEVRLDSFLKQSTPTKPNLIVVVECSPLICSFRSSCAKNFTKEPTYPSVDLNLHNTNDQIIKYLLQLSNVFIIHNNDSIEEFKVSARKLLKKLI